MKTLDFYALCMQLRENMSGSLLYSEKMKGERLNLSGKLQNLGN